MRSETKGTLSEENRRQVAILTGQVFLHIDEGRQAVDADDLVVATSEVDKARKVLQAVLLPSAYDHGSHQNDRSGRQRDL